MRLVLLVAASVLLLAGPTRAQSPTAETIEQREARLLAAAKAEGEVTVYSTAPPEDNQALVDAFEARTHIHVNLWRGKSEDILQRTLAEATAGVRTVDALINTGVGLETMHREGLLPKISSRWTQTLIPEAAPAHGEWIGFYLAPMVQFANTGVIRKADLPKSWDDLADPKWKGKLGIESADSDWLQAVIENMGRDKGLAAFREIAKNHVSVRRGHSLLANLVVAGEVPFALTAYQFTTQQIKDSGAPVEWYSIGPAFTPQVAVALLKQPPHPNAAQVFADFLLGPAQDVLAKRSFVASRKDVFAKAGFEIKVQDAPAAIDGQTEWEGIYKSLFSTR